MSITNDGQGNVQIKFEPRKENIRRSFSASSSNSFLEIRSPSRRSNVQSNLNLEEVDYRSPTYFPMMSPNEEPSQLMMMAAENMFEINKEFLRKEAKSIKHAEKSKWFFSKLTNEQREKFRNQWYQTMETMEMNIPMFTYFDIYAANNQINYPFEEINMFQKEWIPNTTSERKVVSTHPSLEEIKIKAQGVEIIASPFKTINEDESRSIKLRDIKGIQQQNNFTNQILGTISSQLNRIEKNIPNNNPKIKENEKEKVKK